ncbi:MAG: sodium:solute symporter family protein [Eubacteriales bacterium]|jgi:SSS family solute:Na+ symporter
MLNPTLLWMVFALYLLFMVTVSTLTARRQARQGADARSFLTGSSSISWPMLVMTYIASLMSTWVFFAGPGAYYRAGLGYWLSEMSYICLFPVITHFTMNKIWVLNTSRHYVTPADFFCDRFRSRALRLVLGLVFLSASFPYVASVLMAIGKAGDIATGGQVGYEAIVITVGIVIVLLTMLGGMRSVATSDTLQGLLFISILLLIAGCCLWVGFGGSLPDALSTIWQNTNSWFSYPGPDGWVPYAARFGYPFSCAIGWTIMLPHVFVRAGYSGQDLNSQRKLMFLTPILQGIVWTGTMLIGLIGIALLPGLSTSDTELIIPYLIQHVISGVYPTLAILLMIGFFLGAVAVGISTADSFLLVAGSIVYQDFLEHLFHWKLTERGRMRTVRVVILLIGVISILFALNPPDLIYTLIMFSIALVMPLFVLVVLALYWPRATRMGALCGAIAGTIVVLMTYFVWNVGDVWYGAFGLLAAAVVMVLVSLLDRSPQPEQAEFQEALQKGMERFYFLPKQSQ